MPSVWIDQALIPRRRLLFVEKLVGYGYGQAYFCRNGSGRRVTDSAGGGRIPCLPRGQDRGEPAEEVERLHLLAESLFQAVSDYQLRVIAKARGTDLPPLH